MPTIEVSFAALPEHVRTARLVAVAVARRARVDDAQLDELRLAVGEACSRAVALHQQHAPHDLVQMRLSDDEDRFTVEVIDAGPSDHFPPAMDALVLALEESLQQAALVPSRRTPEEMPTPASATARDVLPPGFRLAVIAGLVEDVNVSAENPVGTRVRMTWPAGAQAGESLAAAE